MNEERRKYKITRLACYSSYFTMSSVFSLPPVLFVPLRTIFGISYTRLGSLVLFNFFTQLTVDLLFTLFFRKKDARKVLRFMPLLTTIGLSLFALLPTLFPSFAYGGLVIGTIIFSIGSGMSEVLLSPTIASLPSDNPQRDMSFLHSLYAFGVFSVVLVSTLFLKIFTQKYWAVLTLILAVLPIIPVVLFILSPMPDIRGEEAVSTVQKTKERTIAFLLCIGCIFLGSCAENAMSSWVSSYAEKTLGIDKALGDILGLAGFAVLLGITRIAYAKFGKNISKILLIGMAGASACYLIIGLSNSVVFAFIACVLTGMFTSMLWPGTLIMMEEKIPFVGVGAYALMASAGDFGASLAPQLLGIVADEVAESGLGARLGETLNLTAEQVGLKAGMLVTAIFPILGTILMIFAVRFFKKHNLYKEKKETKEE